MSSSNERSGQDNRDIQAKHAPQAPLPKITVLVAAWNEVHNIDSFIQSYLDLDYPRLELVLCAGGSDGTFERATKHAGHSIQVLLQEKGEGKQRALRKGFEHVTGDIVVLTDADCLLNQESLIRLVAPILREEYAVTSGHCVPKRTQLSNPFVFYQYALEQKRQPAIHKKKTLKALLGRNCALQQSVLEEVGAFNEDVPIGTDSFLAKKVIMRGYEIGFVPDSVVETDFPANVIAYARQKSRWRRNGIMYNLQFRYYRRALRAVLLPFRGLAILMLPFLALRFGKRLLFVWSLFFAYSFLGRARSVHALRTSLKIVSPSIYLKIIPYLLVEWGAPALAILQLFSRRTRSQW